MDIELFLCLFLPCHSLSFTIFIHVHSSAFTFIHNALTTNMINQHKVCISTIITVPLHRQQKNKQKYETDFSSSNSNARRQRSASGRHTDSEVHPRSSGTWRQVRKLICGHHAGQYDFAEVLSERHRVCSPALLHPRI